MGEILTFEKRIFKREKKSQNFLAKSSVSTRGLKKNFPVFALHVIKVWTTEKTDSSIELSINHVLYQYKR